MLYYLSKLNFIYKVNDDDIENLRCVKRILVKEFEDYIIPNLIDVLNIVDSLFISPAIGGLQDILIKTDTLREIILFLFPLKQFVKSKIESH